MEKVNFFQLDKIIFLGDIPIDRRFLKVISFFNFLAFLFIQILRFLLPPFLGYAFFK